MLFIPYTTRQVTRHTCLDEIPSAHISSKQMSVRIFSTELKQLRTYYYYYYSLLNNYRPGESYRLWRVVVCDQETSKTRRLNPTTGL